MVHYCGHVILPDGRQRPLSLPHEEGNGGRRSFEATFEQLNVGFGFGSLAAGADILACRGPARARKPIFMWFFRSTK